MNNQQIWVVMTNGGTGNKMSTNVRPVSIRQGSVYIRVTIVASKKMC